MIIQIRRSCFETNSSSTHCLVLLKNKTEIFSPLYNVEYSYEDDHDNEEYDKLYGLESMGDEPSGKRILDTIKKQLNEHDKNLRFSKIDDDGNIICRNVEDDSEEGFTFYIYEYEN